VAGFSAGARSRAPIGSVQNFLGHFFSGGFETHLRGRVRVSRPAVTGAGDRSGRVRYWRPFGGRDLHWVGGF